MPDIVFVFLNGNCQRNKIVNLLESFSKNDFYFLDHLKNDKCSETLVFPDINNDEFNKKLRNLRTRNHIQFNTFTIKKKKIFSTFGKGIENNLPEFGVISAKALVQILLILFL